MKRKALTIALAVLVCGIWAAVLSRTVSRRPGGDVALNAHAERPFPMLATDTLPRTADLGHYRDPFLADAPTPAARPAATTTVRAPSARAAKPSVPGAAFAWPRIAFLGVLRNTNGARAVALLNIDDRPAMLLQGAEDHGLKVLALCSDSVTIAAAGEARTFRR